METDYISREKALQFRLTGNANRATVAQAVADAIAAYIKAIPAADVRPVKEGHWTAHVLKNANVPWGYDCSECGAWFVIGPDYIGKYHHCPNCGAKMGGSPRE